MERGPFPGSILVAAAAVLAGLGFVGNKLYKAKAPEVRKVRAQLPGCLKRVTLAVGSLIKAPCTKQCRHGL